MIHGPSGSAGFAGLGDQCAQGHSADDAVSPGKVGRFRPHAQGELADDGAPVGDDEFGQPEVFAGIDRVQAVAQDGDGKPTGVDGRPVRLGIDPQGQAADHRDAVSRQRGAQVGGDAISVIGGAPGSHHRN